MKKLTIYDELSTITIIDLELELSLITSKDSLERVVVGYDIFRDAEIYEMIQVLDIASIFIRIGNFEPLYITYGPPPKPSSMESLKLKIKILSSHLKYAYLGEIDTIPIILFIDLSQE